ncbi:uncharacterized protein UTRI_04702 [Ustilago trichophora]|uniref:Uncharacterized protein n=1 Tax=Ustilago trichophora TaxID=86804 RepID=A0A5C3EE59_9BASI|nr:uncharacterized protein UTRI_04702 [Ustilago trichophora]
MDVRIPAFSYECAEECLTIWASAGHRVTPGDHVYDISLPYRATDDLTHISRDLAAQIRRSDPHYGDIYIPRWLFNSHTGYINGFCLDMYFFGDNHTGFLAPTNLPWQETPTCLQIYIEGRLAIYRGVRPYSHREVVLTVEQLHHDSDLSEVCSRLYLMLHHLVDIHEIKAFYRPSNEPGVKTFTGDLTIGGFYWTEHIDADMLPLQYVQAGRGCPMRVLRHDGPSYPHSQFDFMRIRPWPNPSIQELKRLRKKKKPSGPLPRQRRGRQPPLRDESTNGCINPRHLQELKRRKLCD